MTGYGVIEKKGRELHPLKWGAIRTKQSLPFPEKLKIIYDGLIEAIKSYEPSTVAIENIFFGENARSALKLGQARGAAILAAINSDLKVSEYTPLEIKQAITGYGRADKKQVQVMVSKLLGLKEIPKPLDASDALAIALCHIHSADFMNKVNKRSQESRGN